MEQLINYKYIVAAAVFSAVGMVLLMIAFLVFDKLTPGDLWKEIVIEKNMPLALVSGSFMLAIAQIIASAIHG